MSLSNGCDKISTTSFAINPFYQRKIVKSNHQQNGSLANIHEPDTNEDKPFKTMSDSNIRKQQNNFPRSNSSSSLEFLIEGERMVSALCGISKDSPVPFKEPFVKIKKQVNILEFKSTMDETCSVTNESGSIIDNEETDKTIPQQIIELAIEACLTAESIAVANKARPCFKNIEIICEKTRSNVQKPDSAVANLHSQGVPWVIKNFIFSFVRILDGWKIIKELISEKHESFAKIESKYYSPRIRECFLDWQFATRNMLDHIYKTFKDLDTGYYSERQKSKHANLGSLQNANVQVKQILKHPEVCQSKNKLAYNQWGSAFSHSMNSVAVGRQISTVSSQRTPFGRSMAKASSSGDEINKQSRDFANLIKIPVNIFPKGKNTYTDQFEVCQPILLKNANSCSNQTLSQENYPNTTIENTYTRTCDQNEVKAFKTMSDGSFYDHKNSIARSNSSTSLDFFVEGERMVSALCGISIDSTAGFKEASVRTNDNDKAEIESLIGETSSIIDSEVTDKTIPHQIIQLAIEACLAAESIAVANKARPCFKNIEIICEKTRSNVQKPDSAVANLHSQGVPWVIKNFIFSFVRILDGWKIIKELISEKHESFTTLENKYYSPKIRECFSEWQFKTRNMLYHIYRTFKDLDTGFYSEHRKAKQTNLGTFQNSNAQVKYILKHPEVPASSQWGNVYGNSFNSATAGHRTVYSQTSPLGRPLSKTSSTGDGIHNTLQNNNADGIEFCHPMFSANYSKTPSQENFSTDSAMDVTASSNVGFVPSNSNEFSKFYMRPGSYNLGLKHNELATPYHSGSENIEVQSTTIHNSRVLDVNPFQTILPIPLVPFNANTSCHALNYDQNIAATKNVEDCKEQLNTQKTQLYDKKWEDAKQMASKLLSTIHGTHIFNPLVFTSHADPQQSIPSSVIKNNNASDSLQNFSFFNNESKVETNKCNTRCDVFSEGEVFSSNNKESTAKLNIICSELNKLGVDKALDVDFKDESTFARTNSPIDKENSSGDAFKKSKKKNNFVTAKFVGKKKRDVFYNKLSKMATILLELCNMEKKYFQGVGSDITCCVNFEDVIKDPITFNKLSENLKNGLYNDCEQIASEIRHIFYNAYTYMKVYPNKQLKTQTDKMSAYFNQSYGTEIINSK